MTRVRMGSVLCFSFLLALIAIVALRSDEADLEKQIQKILAAEDAVDVSNGYQKLFRQIGHDGIRELKDHNNLGVALRAAWEVVRLTVPEKEVPGIVVDGEALERFLTFAKKRLPAPIPRWWQMALMSAEAHRRDNIYFRLHGAAKHVEVGAGLLGKPGVEVTQRGRKLLVTVGEDSVLVPKAVLEKGRFKGYLAAAIEAKRAYLACYGSCHFGCPLYCVDRDSGKLTWTAQVWADGGLMNHSGPHVHAVTIVPREKQVILFGASTGLYVEAFNAETGGALYRFCTDY